MVLIDRLKRPEGKTLELKREPALPNRGWASVVRQTSELLPIFEEIGTRLRLTLFTERVGLPPLDGTDQAIVDARAGGKGLLTSEIAGGIPLTPRATRTRLARLAASGLLRGVGTRPQGLKRRYYRAE